MKFFIILLFSMICCAGFKDVKENNDYIHEERLKIRYINMSILFDYLANRDTGALELKTRKNELILELNNISGILPVNPTMNEPGNLRGKKENLENQLNEIAKDEEHYKSGILKIIDNALEIFSKKNEIDFVLNIGEGALYARKEYDITEDVLQEIISIQKRSSPVSR